MFIENKYLELIFISVNLYAQEITPDLGNPAPVQLIEQWNTDVFPDGEGLPKGEGNAILGKQIYQLHCLACHGVEGMGNSADELAGAEHSLTDNPPDKIVGNYWPYATTLFDFINRAMPLSSPGVLTHNEVYSVTAYLLYLNGLIKQQTVINAKTLTAIKMPNTKGFINVYDEEKSGSIFNLFNF